MTASGARAFNLVVSFASSVSSSSPVTERRMMAVLFTVICRPPDVGMMNILPSLHLTIDP